MWLFVLCQEHSTDIIWSKTLLGHTLGNFFSQIALARRRGAVDIASASGTRRTGFESR
jgi:hypothetical protein